MHARVTMPPSRNCGMSMPISRIFFHCSDGICGMFLMASDFTVTSHKPGFIWPALHACATGSSKHTARKVLFMQSSMMKKKAADPMVISGRQRMAVHHARIKLAYKLALSKGMEPLDYFNFLSVTTCGKDFLLN